MARSYKQDLLKRMHETNHGWNYERVPTTETAYFAVEVNLRSRLARSYKQDLLKRMHETNHGWNYEQVPTTETPGFAVEVESA